MALWHKYAWVAYLAVFLSVCGHASSEFFSVLSGIKGPELSVWRFLLGSFGLVMLALIFPASRNLLKPFGEYGLQALEAGWLTSKQIEAARVALTRYIKRGGKVWINVFPHKPVTKKPAETRMGGGKGAPENWVAVVKPGKVIFELSGVSLDIAKEAIRLASNKLSIKTKFIYGE